MNCACALCKSSPVWSRWSKTEICGREIKLAMLVDSSSLQHLSPAKCISVISLPKNPSRIVSISLGEPCFHSALSSSLDILPIDTSKFKIQSTKNIWEILRCKDSKIWQKEYLWAHWCSNSKRWICTSIQWAFNHNLQISRSNSFNSRHIMVTTIKTIACLTSNNLRCPSKILHLSSLSSNNSYNFSHNNNKQLISSNSLWEHRSKCSSSILNNKINNKFLSNSSCKCHRRNNLDRCHISNNTRRLASINNLYIRRVTVRISDSNFRKLNDLFNQI